ncbi:MAG: thiamine-phosphate kinase [Candidatus Cybelea sp.]
MTEDELVQSIRAVIDECHPERARAASAIEGGDDAALWQPSRSHRSAISTDMLVEGVHFTRAAMSLEDAGWRAMAANVSDLCAMGARPVLATVALGLPEATPMQEVLELYRGLARCAGACKLAIVGGDLSRAGELTIAIAVVGEVRASNAKLRTGGRPGDVLAVTAPLGAARAGLEVTRNELTIGDPLAQEALDAFRRPQPRIAEGRFLGASRNVTAMMDISDGLSTDVHRLAAASGCGAEIESVPVAQSARACARALGEEPQRFALSGGEDFELLVAVRSRAFGHVAARYAAHFKRDLYRVGVLATGSGIFWNGASLERSGWDHFAG